VITGLSLPDGAGTWRKAHAAISQRLDRLSLAKMLHTWVSTVRSDRTSSAAMLPLLRCGWANGDERGGHAGIVRTTRNCRRPRHAVVGVDVGEPP
jgi:hypothetical protein